MKLTFPLPRLFAGALFLCVATGSSALTLGRLQGLALVGRPLDISVPVLLDAGSDPAELCLEADVFYGETRLDASRVGARLESVAGRNGTVRVSSLAALDEPVVTVILRVG